MLRNKCQYLKVFIIDEMSMIGRESFGYLGLALKVIVKNSSPFGGVSLLVVIHLLQVLPFNQKGVFMEIYLSMDIYGNNSSCMSWLELFAKAMI